MSSVASKENIANLTTELQAQFKFAPDPTGEWLQSDKFKAVDMWGYIHGEQLPTVARLSKDGTRFEIGRHKADLEGLLALTRLVSRRQVKGVDNVISFWDKHPGFKATEDQDTMFLGFDIEPTTKALEARVGLLREAYEIAINSTLTGRSYEQMLKDSWFGRSLKGMVHIEDAVSGFMPIFRQSKRRFGAPASGSSCPIDPPVTAERLRDFPLETYKTSLHNIPATLTRDGVTKELTVDSITGHNGLPAVDLHFYLPDEQGHIGPDPLSKYVQFFLPIPDTLDVKTVADIRKLRRMIVYEGRNRDPEEMFVAINVQDNSFEIASLGGSHKLEVRNLTCTDCKAPYWRFRVPSEEESKKDFSFDRDVNLYGVSSGKGEYICSLETGQGEHTYCYDCVQKFTQNYVEEHPLASRKAAARHIRGKLREIGYEDVEVPLRRSDRLREGDGWRFYTQIQYQREGRNITRYTGEPTLTDEGEFKPNMTPRKYIDFRF